MTREEILKELKELISSLVPENGENRFKNPEFCKDFSKKQKKINEESCKLNSCDANWINDEYGKWLRSEMSLKLSNIDPSIKSKIEWL